MKTNLETAKEYVGKPEFKDFLKSLEIAETTGKLEGGKQW